MAGLDQPQDLSFPLQSQAQDGQREATSSICVAGTHAMQAAFILVS